MGPGGETNLLVALVVLGAIGGTVWALRQQVRRAGRYFVNWWERDKRAEAEAQRQAAMREEAEKEVRTLLVEDDPEDAEGEVQREKPCD